MKTELYKITTLSNLHVGSGEINFNIIDNQVQKSPEGLPIINSSSLKGAFREHFAEEKGDESKMVTYIFGPPNTSNDSHITGAYSFFEATLLTRPARSNVKFFFNATSPAVLKRFLNNIEMFDISFDDEVKSALQTLSDLKPEANKPMIFEDIKDVRVEDLHAAYNACDVSVLSTFLGEDLVLLSDADYMALELPILARNYLEEGVSKNLWYEEVVPKQSTFYFMIAKPDNLDTQDKAEKIERFENMFTQLGSRIQFGANKSIGYGYSLVQKVSHE